ncbi:hypothetical protein L1887_49918 [Cichorium endivia]|nr:hypothetical protein L1887_49918 [Cichorium endivia]
MRTLQAPSAVRRYATAAGENEFVAERAHHKEHAESADLWRKVSLYVCIPGCKSSTPISAFDSDPVADFGAGFMFAMIAIVLGVYIYGIEKHHYDHMVHEFHENDNQPPERTFYEYNVSPPPTITRTAILRMRMQLTHAARFGIVEHSQEGLPLGRRLQVVLPQRHDQPPQGPLNIFSSCSTNTFLSLAIFTTEASEYQIPFYTSEMNESERERKWSSGRRKGQRIVASVCVRKGYAGSSSDSRISQSLLRLEDHLLDAPGKRRDLALGTRAVVRAVGPLVLGALVGRERGEVLDERQQLLGAADVVLQLRIARLEQLHDRPHSNVLEGGVVRLEEAHQVAVQAALGLVPHRVERRIVVGFRREVAQRRRRVALHLDRGRRGERDEHLADAHLEQLRLEVLGERQHGRTRRHLALHAQRHVEHELLDALHRARLDDRRLVALARRGEVAQRADGVALDLFVVLVAQQVDERVQEAGVDDGRLVGRVDGDVAHARRRRQDERQERRAQQSQQRRQAVGTHDLDLVLFVRRKVTQRERRLALHLERRALHEADQVLHESRLGLGELLAVGRVDGNVAERSGAVVLHVRVRAAEKADEHGDGASVDELLAVLVAVCHVEQRTRGVALHTHVLGSSQARERDQCARLGDLGLVVVVGGEVSDAADGVALHFDVGAEHLSDQGLEAAELDDKQLVLGIDGEVAERSTGGALHLDVVTLQEEHDGLERVAADLAHLLFRDLGKGERSAALGKWSVRDQAAVRRIPATRQLLTFKVLQQICDGISLIVEQERFVVGVPGGAAAATTANDLADRAAASDGEGTASAKADDYSSQMRAACALWRCVGSSDTRQVRISSGAERDRLIDARLAKACGCGRG